MIRSLLRLNSDRGRALLTRVIALVVVTAVLQGLAFVALVPFLSALLTGDDGAAQRWLIVLVGITVGYVLAFWFGSQAGNAAASETLLALLHRLGDRLVQLPQAWFAHDRAGEMSDLATRGIVFASAAPYAILRPILNGFITPATVLVGAFVLDWRIGVTMAATVPLMWAVHGWISRRTAVIDREHAATVAAASARVIEFARLQPALRAAGDNSLAQTVMDDALRAQHSATRTMHLVGGAGIAVFGGVVRLAVAGAIVVGTHLTLTDRLGLATLVPLLVLAVRFTEPITNSGALSGGVSVARNSLTVLEDLLAHPTLSEPSIAATPADHGIRLDQVSFGYDDRPVVTEVTFEVPSGTMTAIVGPSGSGKTTLTRLMARFYDPDAGKVSIGGVPMPDLGSAQIADLVAPVFQDVYLFNGTIAENVWLGDPQASRDQMLEAAGRARVDEIVARLPQGWESRVGEGGTNLSGGERQRVSIARALLKNAPIIVLDEATAALDIDNERAIQDTIAHLRATSTLVVVAHRLQTIATADQIIMLGDDGCIREMGTHAELLAAGAGYAHYWRERESALGWRVTDPADRDVIAP